MSKTEEILNNWGAADEALQEQIDKCVKKDEWNTLQVYHTHTEAKTLENTGIIIECPIDKVVEIVVRNNFTVSAPVSTVITRSNTNTEGRFKIAEGTGNCHVVYFPNDRSDGETKLYVWSSHVSATTDLIHVKYRYV